MKSGWARLAIAICSVALLPFGGCGADPNTVATYNGGTVERPEVEAALAQAGQTSRPLADDEIRDWLRDRALDVAIAEMLRLRAAENGLADDPALDLRARYLASQQVARQFLGTQCPEPEADREELQRLYEANSRQEPRAWILLRHIYRRADPHDPAARRAVHRELEDVRSALEGGADFIELARRHSDSDTASDGGLIGRISRSAPLEPAVRDAAWALEDGEISDVVEVENGFHLLLREESGVEQPRDFESLGEGLVERWVVAQREACAQRYIAQLALERPVAAVLEALAADDPEAVTLTVGDESFTLDELRGLTADLRGHRGAPNFHQLLRNFAESLLIARAASEEDATTTERLSATRQEIKKRLVEEWQWREERHKLVADYSDEKLRRFYDRQPQRFHTELTLEPALILVEGRGLGRREVWERAHGLRQRILDGEPFAQVAADSSSHPSAANGGELGLLPLSRLQVLLGSGGAKTVAALDEGEISAPFLVRSTPPFAYAIVEVRQRLEPRARSFEEARERVIEVMASERIQQLDRELRERLREEIGFRVNEEAIDGFALSFGG